MDDTGRQLQTVQNSIRIIEALDSFGTAGITDISEEVGMNPGAVHTHLNTLRRCEYVTKIGSKYRLSYRFLQKGNNVRRRYEIFDAAIEEVQRLAEETDENVLLMVEEFGKGIDIYQMSGERGVASEYISRKVGIPAPLHVNAPGKAIFANLSEERIKAIIETTELVQETHNTITTRSQLRTEFETIRDQGYALNDEEEDYRLRAVAAPVINSSGTVLGAISVSGPTSRISDEVFTYELPELVKEAANITEINVDTETS
jgi:DNA-binding IclR family transcriptional regulator